MSKLVAINEEMKDRTFELTEDRVTVGRLPDNHIHIDDPAISSHHAELTRRGEDYVVRDLNSTNGTRVNGQRIVETRLYHGDTVGFSQIQLQYFSAAKGAPQPLPSPKKTVDLSKASPTTTTGRPTDFRRASPFATDANKSKKWLQIAVVVLGLIATVLLAYLIIKIVSVPSH